MMRLKLIMREVENTQSLERIRYSKIIWTLFYKNWLEIVLKNSRFFQWALIVLLLYRFVFVVVMRKTSCCLLL